MSLVNPGMDIQNQNSREAVAKCARFFKTLLRLAEKQQQPQETVERVRQLVRGVVFDKFSPEDFTTRLQRTLNSQAQQNLLPFLKQTLPSLRTALQRGEQVIEGIGTLEEYKAEMINSEWLPTDNRSLAPINNTVQPYSNVNSNAVLLSSSTTKETTKVESEEEHISSLNINNASTSIANNSSTLETSINGVIHNALNNNVSSTIMPPVSEHSTPIFESFSQPNQQSQLVAQHNVQPMTQQHQQQNFMTSQQTDVSQLRIQSQVQHSQQISMQPLLNGQQPTTSTNSTIMGPIVPENFPYTCLNAQAIVNRIYARMPECEGIDEECIKMISNVAEQKMRSLIIKLSMVAEHRLEPLKLNPNYCQIDDSRKQLRFVEEIERKIAERRETIEREALLKFSKSKGKDKDTLERVKQIQKADKEAELNREANEAAIAALGGLRGTKRINSTNSVFQKPVSSGISLQTHRPKMKRISARDLQLVLSSDPYGSKTNVYYRLCYSSPSLVNTDNATKSFYSNTTSGTQNTDNYNSTLQ